MSLSGSPPPTLNEKHDSIFGIWVNIGEYGGNVVLSFFLWILFIITKDMGKPHALFLKTHFNTHKLYSLLSITNIHADRFRNTRVLRSVRKQQHMVLSYAGCLTWSLSVNQLRFLMSYQPHYLINTTNTQPHINILDPSLCS